MKSDSQQPIQVPRFNEQNGFRTTKQRSKLMSKIRSKNTKSEELLRKALWQLGIRYRKNDPRLPGKPDIVIQKHRLVIFVDGEFWHGYGWDSKRAKIKANPNFWIPKIERNIQRDLSNNALLSKQGWIVLRFWDQQVKKEFGACLKKILNAVDPEIYLDYTFPDLSEEI